MGKRNQLFGSSTKLEIQDIHEFEKKYCISLPADYQQFLLVSNGGCPERGIFESRTGESVFVNYFFPIEDGTTTGLDTEIGRFPGCVENGFLPIALDGTGKVIFLRLSEGGIYAWNPEIGSLLEPEMGFNVDMLIHLAGNIGEFIDGLFELN